MAGETRQGLTGLSHERRTSGRRMASAGQDFGERSLGHLVGGVAHGAGFDAG
jgi:hypothetical protein